MSEAPCTRLVGQGRFLDFGFVDIFHFFFDFHSFFLKNLFVRRLYGVFLRR